MSCITSDEVLNSLVYGSPFCVIIYTSYKLPQKSYTFTMVRFWPILYFTVSKRLKNYLNLSKTFTDTYT